MFYCSSGVKSLKDKTFFVSSLYLDAVSKYNLFKEDSTLELTFKWFGIMVGSFYISSISSSFD